MLMSSNDTRRTRACDAGTDGVMGAGVTAAPPSLSPPVVVGENEMATSAGAAATCGCAASEQNKHRHRNTKKMESEHK